MSSRIHLSSSKSQQRKTVTTIRQTYRINPHYTQIIQLSIHHHSVFNVLSLRESVELFSWIFIRLRSKPGAPIITQWLLCCATLNISELGSIKFRRLTNVVDDLEWMDLRIDGTFWLNISLNAVFFVYCTFVGNFQKLKCPKYSK